MTRPTPAPTAALASARRVAIIGGGLAGMAAAAALHSAGVDVALIEARKTLGGRAGSFDDPATGQTLDNCQHVVLGCCTNLLDLYRRLGVLDRIEWQDRIRFVDPRGKSHWLWSTPATPAPLHLSLATALLGALQFHERLALTHAMLAMLRITPIERAKLADISFGQWLAAHDQPDSLTDKFYELVLISALNERCRDANAGAAIQVFQEGMLFHTDAYRMGTPACPLTQLYEKLPCPDVRLGTRVTAVRFNGNRVAAVEMGEEQLAVDAVVMAVNYPTLERFLPGELYRQDSRFGGLDHLHSVPILGAHLWFDRPVLDTPHAALMGGPLQWLFRKDTSGRAVHGVISAAREWVNVPKEQCLEQFQRQICRTMPGASGARLERGIIVIEKRATFSPLPGVDRFRPPQAPSAGGIANLYLAGDYTQTGWPATMEGAVRSGYLAAEAVLQTPGKFLRADLPIQWPARLMRLAGRLPGMGSTSASAISGSAAKP